MRRVVLLLLGIAALVGIATEASTKVTYRYDSDGARARLEWIDASGRMKGRLSLDQMTGGYYFHASISVQENAYSWRYLTYGSGYLPESAVTGNVHSGLRINFDSSTLPYDTFWTMGNIPVTVDVALVSDGNITEKHIGTHITENGFHTTHTHGMSEKTSATGSGTVFGYPILLTTTGEVGTNKGMSVMIEDKN